MGQLTNFLFKLASEERAKREQQQQQAELNKQVESLYGSLYPKTFQPDFPIPSPKLMSLSPQIPMGTPNPTSGDQFYPPVLQQASPQQLPQVREVQSSSPQWDSPETQKIMLNMLTQPGGMQTLNSLMSLQKMNQPDEELRGGEGMGLWAIDKRGGKYGTPRNVFPPTFTKKSVNVDYQRLLGKDGKEHTYKIINDSTTGEEIKREDLGIPGTPSSGAGLLDQQDSKNIAEEIQAGRQPPDSKGMYRAWAGIRAEMAKSRYDLTTAEKDWTAISRHITSLNGTQQERLRQAISFTNDTLPQLQDAYNKWKKQARVSGFKIINKATLATMKNLPGEAGSAASNLDALISDFTSELGVVYRGGNASTDESLKLAAQNLKSEWNETTWNDAMSRLDRSLKIRRNSIFTSQPVGVSPESKFLTSPTGEKPTGENPTPKAKNWWE